MSVSVGGSQSWRQRDGFPSAMADEVCHRSPGAAKRSRPSRGNVSKRTAQVQNEERVTTKCALDILRDLDTPEEIRQRFRELPKGSNC